MKIRNGFVSNSSSSSFVIKLSDITEEQLEKIKNHIEEAKKLDEENKWKLYQQEESNYEPFGKYINDYDAWNIVINENKIRGNTFMDNFDMQRFLSEIGIDSEKVEFSYEN